MYDGNVENDPFEQFLKAFTVAELEDQRRQYIELMREYESRITALSALIEIVEAIEARGARTSAAAGRKSSADPKRPALGRAIQTVMASDPKRGWTAGDLLPALESQGWAPGGDTPRNSLDATLSRLARTGAVERRGKGVYALPSSKQAS